MLQSNHIETLKSESENLYFLKTVSKLSLYMKVKKASVVWCSFRIRYAFSNCCVSVINGQSSTEAAHASGCDMEAPASVGVSLNMRHAW